MLNVPAAVTTFLLQNNVAWRADLYTLTLVDGVPIFRYATTGFDRVYSGQTYKSGVVKGRGALRIAATLEVASLDVDSAGTELLAGKAASLRAIQGYFDDARLQIDHLVGRDPPNAIANGAIMAWYEGRVGGLDVAPQVLKLHVLRGDDLNTLLPQFEFAPSCSHAVYDP